MVDKNPIFRFLLGRVCVLSSFSVVSVSVVWWVKAFSVGNFVYFPFATMQKMVCLSLASESTFGKVVVNAKNVNKIVLPWKAFSLWGL